jgi:hypothetical protein
MNCPQCGDTRLSFNNHPTGRYDEGDLWTCIGCGAHGESDELNDLEILVTGFVRDEGTLVLLSGLTQSNKEVVFVCDHHMAPDILAAVEAGEEPIALVPSYAIWG